MALGINAGFGQPLGADAWTRLAALGFSHVRTGLPPWATDGEVEAMVRDLVGAPLTPLLLVASKRIERPDGQRIEAGELAAHVVRVVSMAIAAGLRDFAIHLGNEADISAYDHAPKRLADVVVAGHDAARSAGFAGDFVAPSVANVSARGVDYLGDMLRRLPQDVVAALHMYPPAGYVPRPGGDDRSSMWAAVTSVADGRRLWVTEFGMHDGREVMESFGRPKRAVVRSEAECTTGLLSYLSVFERHGVELAFLYQHRDGTSGHYDDHYGIIRADGSEKTQAQLPALWRKLKEGAWSHGC